MNVTNETVTPTDLVVHLLESGLQIDPSIAERIKNTPDTYPHLITILSNEDLWKEECWAPIHALHILSAARSIEAAPIFIRLLKEDPERFGDWLTEEVPSLLYHFGTPIIPQLITLLQDTTAYTYSRNAASRALAAFAYHHPNLKPQIIQSYKELLSRALEGHEDNLLISFCVEEASEALHNY